jgi:regulation of enolase protein 1 (concanavalin A-like superfamily)
MTASRFEGWRWLNEPARWNAAEDGLRMTVERDTDFWRVTHYGFIRHSGHVFGLDVSGDFELELVAHGEYADQYDQAGVMVLADEHTWLKAGIEFVDGAHQASVVITRDHSDWSVSPVPPPVRGFRIMADRRGDTVRVARVEEGGRRVEMRLGYLPPQRPVFVGMMAAAPDGPGFAARFTDVELRIG